MIFMSCGRRKPSCLVEFLGPEWSFIDRKFDFRVVGMVVDESTKDFSVIVSSEVRPICPGPGEVDRQGRVSWELDKWKHLHHFDSTAGVWSWCGNGGMNLRRLSHLVGVVMHRDCVLVLVMRAAHYRIQRYNGSCSWDTLPGNCPYSGNKFPVLCDRKGKLRLAVPSSSGCDLWEYDDDSCVWSLTHLLPNTGFYHSSMDREYVDTVTSDYCIVAGDSLHFGKMSYTGVTSCCRRMKYNLTTRVLEGMSRDERHKKVIRDISSTRLFIFEAA